MKTPYRYPLRSRAAITDFLLEHQSYHPMNSWNGGRVLAWNIKVYHFDETGHTGAKAAGDVTLHERFDAAWEEHCEQNDMFREACGNALSYYCDEALWTPYPGPGEKWQQGTFKFFVNGRSGGYLCLDRWPITSDVGAWRHFPMAWHDSGHFEGWIKDLDWPTLRTVYKVVVELDHDLSREAVTSEINYQFAWLRSQFEEGLLADERADADALMEARPDMYRAAEMA